VAVNNSGLAISSESHRGDSIYVINQADIDRQPLIGQMHLVGPLQFTCDTVVTSPLVLLTEEAYNMQEGKFGQGYMETRREYARRNEPATHVLERRELNERYYVIKGWS